MDTPDASDHEDDAAPDDGLLHRRTLIRVPVGVPNRDHDSESPNRFLALNVPSPRHGPKRHDSSSADLFHIKGLVADRVGNYEHVRKSEDELKRIKDKSVRQFYERQNQLLDYFAEADRIIDGVALPDADVEASPLMTRSAPVDEDGLTPAAIRAIVINLCINVVLLAGKGVVALVSGSVSLLASLVDSAMDLASTLIIGAASKFIQHRDWKEDWHWPVGKRRMEPVSIVVFSTVMIASFVQVFIESIQRCAEPDLHVVSLTPWTIAIMLATVVVKGVVWFWCRQFKNASVAALAQDAENDVVFNIFSLIFPLVGQAINWPYLDPIGGAVLSIYIIFEWFQTLIENVRNLAGSRADPLQHQRVAYLVTRFSPMVKGVQYLNCYQSGEGLTVETDIILDKDISLPVSHDLSEAIQLAIECLSGVERAYVHVDVSSVSPSSHVVKT